MIRWRRTTRSATSRPLAVRMASLCSPRSTRPVALEPLEHLARRRARDAEHVGDADGERRRSLRVRAVLPDRERQEIDRLEIVVDECAPAAISGDRFYPCPGSPRSYPLVSARAVARPFTYLADGLEKGAVVSVRFGRARRRGVVVGLGDEAPPDVEPVAVERVVGAVPAPLVDLALWLADYYGSTPARALALVAPPRRPGAPGRSAASATRSFRARRRRPTLSDAQDARARADRGRDGRRRRRPPPLRRDGQREDRGLPPSLRAGARARPGRDRARARRSRSRRRRSGASAPASATASPCSTRG